MQNKAEWGENNMISITICDDEPGTCSDIENIILNYTHSHAIETEIEIFYSVRHYMNPWKKVIGQIFCF